MTFGEKLKELRQRKKNQSGTAGRKAVCFEAGCHKMGKWNGDAGC